MVTLTDLGEMDTVIAQAAGRAAAERRSLLVVLVQGPGIWTIDAAVHAVAARRRSRELAAATSTARESCDRAGVRLQAVTELRRPCSPTRRGRTLALRRRLAAIARLAGAELHPMPVDPSHESRGGRR